MFLSLEGFVQAVGGVLGVARDAFGPGTGGDPVRRVAPASGPAGLLNNFGQAIQAFERESHVMSNHVDALAGQDQGAHAQLVRAVAEAGAGRDRMNAVISGAIADVNRLAALTSQPAGQAALIKAMVDPLEQAWNALNEAHAGASTHAAESARTASAYNGLGSFAGNGTGTAVMSPIAEMAAMQPMMAASAMPMSTMPLTGLAGLAHAGGQYGSGGDWSLTDAEDASLVDPGVGGAVVKRAMQQLGVPYVWGGGGPNGPSGGGFDCSGLVQYAYAGVGVELPRTSEEQYMQGVPVAQPDVRAGDLIFPRSSFGEDAPGLPGHVMLAISSSEAIEAQQSGVPVKVSALPMQFEARRILSNETSL